MMKDKTFLSTVMIMVALLGCLGIADAQNISTELPTAPIPITPELHNKLTKGGAVSSGGGISSAAALTNETVVANALGWNYVHATNCTSYWDGTTTWLYVFPQEGGFWFTANLSSQIAIAPACQTGNWLAFYVYSSDGSWDRVYTYAFK